MAIEELKFETDAPVTVIVKEQPKSYPGQWGNRWRYYAHVPAMRADRVFFCDDKLHQILETHKGGLEPLTICKRTAQNGSRRTLTWEVSGQQQQQPHPPQANAYEDQQRAVAAAVLSQRQRNQQQAPQQNQQKDRYRNAAEQAIEILMHAQSYAHQEFGLDLHVNTGDVRALMAQILIEEGKASSNGERRAA